MMMDSTSGVRGYIHVCKVVFLTTGDHDEPERTPRDELEPWLTNSSPVK